jgi:hypothetical protein
MRTYRLKLHYWVAKKTKLFWKSWKWSTGGGGVRGSVVAWGTMLQVRRFAGSIPDEGIGFFNRPNPSSRVMALGSTQPLIEMSTRNLPGGKGRPARKADKLTAICEPIV